MKTMEELVKAVEGSNMDTQSKKELIFHLNDPLTRFCEQEARFRLEQYCDENEIEDREEILALEEDLGAFICNTSENWIPGDWLCTETARFIEERIGKAVE